MKVRFPFTILMAGLLAASAAFGAEESIRKPSRTDKCPVCGMFIYKYPDWMAQIAFNDGTVFFFDGTKDLFKFYLNLDRYVPGRSSQDIAGIYVTEFYDMTPIDARSAFFVSGSDVYGPMGRELIPFKTEADAGQFLKDHKGQRILDFEGVDPVVIKGLD